VIESERKSISRKMHRSAYVCSLYSSDTLHATWRRKVCGQGASEGVPNNRKTSMCVCVCVRGSQIAGKWSVCAQQWERKI
jgi:hypothetical protein